MTQPGECLDAVVVGAGICGIIFLKYAKDRGLSCVILEKQHEVGGLWTWLPEWQDIQNRREDFAINDVPLHGVDQPAILRHIEEWVRRYDLRPFIRLGEEVTSVTRVGNCWRVATPAQPYFARYVVAATGAQNQPWVPNVRRDHSAIVERHSSALMRPNTLAKRRVTVVGGGASSWDLLDLALQKDAREVHWVCRNPKWFLPTRRSKQTARPNLRTLAMLQASTRSPRAVNRFLRLLLRLKYATLRVQQLRPAERFDIRQHQLIPARAAMLANLERIRRHRGRVASLQGHTVSLEDGASFETDVLLWATGYRVNLAYLDLPEYRDITRVDQLIPRLGSLIRSVDYPSLFFISMSLTESTSATPFLAAIEAKTIVAHICGRCEVPTTIVPYHVAHWRLFQHFASFDTANYPRFWWKIRYFLLACWYAIFPHRTIRL